MSESDPEGREILKRWTPGSLALFVVGLEILVLACVLLIRMERGFLLYSGTAIGVGVFLIVAGQVMTLRQGAVISRWTGGSVAWFVIGLLILAPSGLCTSLGGLYALSSMDEEIPSTQRARESELIMTQLIGTVLVVGGVSMVIGGTFVLAGLKTRRRRDHV